MPAMLEVLWFLVLPHIISKTDCSDSDKLVFRPLLHQPRIYAGAPPGVHVTTVYAYNPDKPRKKVEYNLPNVFDYQSFIVDQISGNLTTAKLIDKKVGETYEVMVAAVSQGSSELEYLQIAVTEFNLYAPRFGRRKYGIELHPQTEVNTTVLQVKATDADPAPHNAEIYYKMDQNLTSKYFNLNSQTGDLKLIHPINETTTHLRFGLFAEDGGSPKRWDYVPVYVTLKNLSAPLNLKVFGVTHSSATVCWEEPLYGEVLGYGISYYPVKTPSPKEMNITIDFDSDTCSTLLDLKENNEYVLQIYAWNEEEKGLMSPAFHFRTTQDGCKDSPCQAGSCEPLAKEPWFACHCQPGFSGSLCEYLDPCFTNPCGSNGKCLNTTYDGYVCVCDGNYSGRNCSKYNPCLRNTNLCENGGTCKMTTDQSYICVCSEKFYGQKCEHTNFCVSNPCYNGGTCHQDSPETFKCLCPSGFTGSFCESEVDNCASDPCGFGSTCVNSQDNFTCICNPGFIGAVCNITSQCPSEKTDIYEGFYEWNATNHGTVAAIKCSFGPLDPIQLEEYALRRCLLIDGEATWDTVDASRCKSKDFIVASELADELHNMTKNPRKVNTDVLEATAEGIETIATYATKNKELAQSMVNVISNVIDANSTVLDEDDGGKYAESLIQSIENFASNVELKPGESLNIASENVNIQTVQWHPTTENAAEDHVELSAPVDNGLYEELPNEEKISTMGPSSVPSNETAQTSPPVKTKTQVFQVFVPKEALQEAHRQLDKSVRLKFIIYYNDKLFQPKKTIKPTLETNSKEEKNSNKVENKEMNPEPRLSTPVLQISVGNVSLKNLDKPLIYILPMITKRKAFCVYWEEKEREWSRKGLKTNQTSDKVICESSHMTAFSVLLDLTPNEKTDETHGVILSLASYIGSFLSIIGLSLTILTYSLFGCLNRDHPGKILLNLCVSLLLMNCVFLVASSKFVTNNDICATVGILTHYFVLCSLSWMCVEAVNMYQLLVQVFASSETHFMFKRFCAAWGIPMLIVAVTAVIQFDAYRGNTETCTLTSRHPLVYYCSFLGPSCLILFTNLIIFLRVSRVIFTPKLTMRSSPDHGSRVTVAQFRGALTVMVLLGITWVFGTMAVGQVRLIFQYFFCFSNSLQGFLIFLVRCLLYPEARNAWLYLLKTGKLKRHRGILPPGTVSFSSNSGGKNGLSPNTVVRTESSDYNVSFDHTSFRHETPSKIVRNSPTTRSVKCKRNERPPHCMRFLTSNVTDDKGRCANGRNDYWDYHEDGQRDQRYKTEMQAKSVKTPRDRFNNFMCRHSCQEDCHEADHKRTADYPTEQNIVLPRITISPYFCHSMTGHLFSLYPVSPQFQKDKRRVSMDTFSSSKAPTPHNDIPMNGRRSMSLDVGDSSPKHHLSDRRRIPSNRRKISRNKRIERTKRNPTCFEEDESEHFDKSSSSTEVEDSASECSSLGQSIQKSALRNNICDTNHSDSYISRSQCNTLFPPNVKNNPAELCISKLNKEYGTSRATVQIDSELERNPIFLKCLKELPTVPSLEQ